MISQSLYYYLRDLAYEENRRSEDDTELIRQEIPVFVEPYVLVIHQPTGRGFYLDREYRHIIDVCRCREPENPVETTRRHLCASPNLPAWAHEEDPMDFDSFWLY